MVDQSTGSDLSTAITRAIRELTKLSGLPVSFGGPVSQDRRSFVITDLSGTHTQSLLRLRVNAGLGLGGKALALVQPVTVQDYVNAQGITHKYDQAVAPEGLHSVMAMPLQVNSQTRAVLYVASRQRLTIGDRLIEQVTPALRKAERDVTLEEEVRRRLALIAESTEQSILQTQNQALNQELQDVHSELTALAEFVSDNETRDRLQHICARLLRPAKESAPTQDAPKTDLTPRELEMLEHIATGATNDQIARDLGLLPNTVKSYVKVAIRKLGAKNRVEAAYRAREAGLINPTKNTKA